MSGGVGAQKGGEPVALKADAVECRELRVVTKKGTSTGSWKAVDGGAILSLFTGRESIFLSALQRSGATVQVNGP